MSSPVSNLPVRHPSVSPSAGLPDTVSMSSINSFPPPHLPGPNLCMPTASAPPLSAVNMSAASPAAPSFSDAAPSFPAGSGPVSSFSSAPDAVHVPICSATGPSNPSVSVVPSSVVAPHVFPLNTDSPLRFTFDELNLPDLYASFKSLVRTMRERGGSQCKSGVCTGVACVH